jgi:quinol monooxygenase YgiN
VKVLWVRVEAGTPERRELIQAFETWLAVARRELGAIEARLCEDLEQPGVYCLTSRWRAGEDLEAHLAGADFGILLGALQVLARRTELELAGRDDGAEDAGSMIRRIRSRTTSPGHWTHTSDQTGG